MKAISSLNSSSLHISKQEPFFFFFVYTIDHSTHVYFEIVLEIEVANSSYFTPLMSEPLLADRQYFSPNPPLGGAVGGAVGRGGGGAAAPPAPLLPSGMGGGE